MRPSLPPLAESSRSPRGTVAMTAGQIETAHRIGERLQGDFSALIRSFPADARTIAGMSRWLDVTQPVCQRLMRAVRHRTDPLRALTFFPGVRGVQQVLDAARRRGADAELVNDTAGAVEAYAALVDEHGGSQARLIAAIESRAHGADVAAAAPARFAGADTDLPRAAFEGIRRVTGRSFDVHFAVFVYRLLPDDPKHMMCVTAMGMIGVRRAAGCLPICPMKTSVYAEREDDAAPEAMPSIITMDGFCSRPVPRIATRRRGAGLPVLIDPDHASPEPFDIVLRTRARLAPSPVPGAADVEECSLVSDGPARALVMSIHLDRTLAQSSIATAGAYALGNRGPIGRRTVEPDGTTVLDSATDRWFDRLPGRPRLESLGPGLEHDASAYPRLNELVAALCGSEGWSPDEFVGYRCHVPHPLFGGQYVVSFDFSDGSAGSG